MSSPSDSDFIDHGLRADWGATSPDYLEFRPDPPVSMFAIFTAFGIGLPGQRVLDLGTGTGALALRFAEQGCHCVGTDISHAQIDAARTRARNARVKAEFIVQEAEDCASLLRHFDVVTANQCWKYFDHDRVLAAITKVFHQTGILSISSFTYLPRLSPIAAASESLVRKFNPSWSGYDWDGSPESLKPRIACCEPVAIAWYDEDIPFTRESWRGRMRALRGIGATLCPDEVHAFDQEHADLLSAIAPERFDILHRIAIHVYRVTS